MKTSQQLGTKGHNGAAARKQIAVMRQKLANEGTRRHAAETALKAAKSQHEKVLHESLDMQEQLRHLSRQLFVAQEEERKRISRELHDEIAQILLGISVHLETLSREAARNTKGIRTKIARTKLLVEKSVGIVHQCARELRPAVLDDLGLIPALEGYIDTFSARTGLAVQFNAYPAVEKLSSGKRTVLYRVVLEALTNAAQHARAKRVNVDIVEAKVHARLRVKDNGAGFDAKGLLASTRIARLGVLGMRERVEMVGGTFSIESIRGEGTQIEALIPLELSRKRRSLTTQS